MKRRARGTDGSLLASLPWTIGALSVSFAAHVPYLPVWISVAFLGCAAWRYQTEKRRTMLASTWVRGGLAVVCFLGVLITYSSISGVGPGTALLAIMAALKLLETRQRRDQFVLLFISIFLVMSSLLREQYLWSLPYLVVSMLVIIVAWLRMSAGEHETARRSLATGSRLMLYAAPLAITMWIFFPRISSPFWMVPIDTSRATSGISDSMSPGDISSLSLSNEVAFRVQFDGEIPESRDLYWRGLVMTRFNGRTWTSFDPRIAARPTQQIDHKGEPVSYTVTLEPTMQQWIFAMEMPSEISLSQTFMGPQQQLFRAAPVEQRLSYDVVSHTDFVIDAELSARGKRWYLETQDSNQRTQEFARNLHDAAGSDTAYIDAVLAKFHNEEYFYTLEPPALGSNPIDRFLFDTRQGFCEHYASAFAFMMRSVGIPSRVVLGYQGGELNPVGGHLIVRQSDAHAWTEVWLEQYGWYRVDPTGAVAPERIEYGVRGATLGGYAASWGFAASPQFLQKLTMAWDALDAKWNEWILAYGGEKQDQFMNWLGMDDPDWQKMLLTLVGCVIAIIVLISGVMMLRYRAPPKDRAARLYARFVRKTGLQQRTGETPQEFAKRAIKDSHLDAEEVQPVTIAYLSARYGAEGESSEDELHSAIAVIR